MLSYIISKQPKFILKTNIFTNFIGLTNAYARGAKQSGATIIEDFPINEIVLDQDSKRNKKIKGVKSEKGYVCHPFCY